MSEKNPQSYDNDLKIILLENTVRYLARHALIEPESPTDTIVLDIETTGLNLIDDEILQLSIIAGSGETLYDSYFKPLHLTKWDAAQKINGISPATVKKAPLLYHEIPKINGILKHAKTIIGYNHLNFDIPFLQLFSAVFPADAALFDVMTAFAPIYGEWDDEHNGYKWQRLSTCAAYYGYDWGADTAHNSLADCRATLHCYRAILQNGGVRHEHE